MKHISWGRQRHSKVQLQRPPDTGSSSACPGGDKKGVYGTKQGSHVWYIDFSRTLTTLGYTPMQAGHAIFVHESPDTFPDIISTYVDDMGLISESLERINRDKEALRQHYEMTDLGEMGPRYPHDSQPRKTYDFALTEKVYKRHIGALRHAERPPHLLPRLGK